VSYAEAVKRGERALAVRDTLIDMNGTFTTYRRIGVRGPAWWPGEVEHFQIRSVRFPRCGRRFFCRRRADRIVRRVGGRHELRDL
jgi:hypothetical protein